MGFSLHAYTIRYNKSEGNNMIFMTIEEFEKKLDFYIENGLDEEIAIMQNGKHIVTVVPASENQKND